MSLKRDQAYDSCVIMWVDIQNSAYNTQMAKIIERALDLELTK